MASVFINYRRADSASWAQKLFGHLSMRYGKDLIFEDVESLRPGEKWMDAIREEIQRCDVFLVLIGPSWLEPIDDQGLRRIDNNEDVLRVEVGEALNAHCAIIPVLVGGTNMPSKEELPDSIAALTEYQAFELGEERWNSDVEELIEQLRELIQPTRRAVSLNALQQEAYQMQLRCLELLDQNNDPAGALECAQKMSRLLDRNLPLFPNDPYLKVCRGFSLKNEARALSRLNRAAESGEALGEAEQVFRTMRSENPRDAAAWNGSGSVAALRRDYKAALVYINKALEIQPDYEAALHDKQEILKQIGQV